MTLLRPIWEGLLSGWALIWARVSEYPLTACSLLLFAVVWLR